MFILSAEGQNYIREGLWASHLILGSFESREKAFEYLGVSPKDAFKEDVVYILTDLSTMQAERIA